MKEPTDTCRKCGTADHERLESYAGMVAMDCPNCGRVVYG